jgi:CheY-like chemotaxis protein
MGNCARASRVAPLFLLDPAICLVCHVQPEPRGCTCVTTCPADMTAADCRDQLVYDPQRCRMPVADKRSHFNERIAIVDDSSSTRKLLQHYLVGLPYEVVQYANGAELVSDATACRWGDTLPRAPVPLPSAEVVILPTLLTPADVHPPAPSLSSSLDLRDASAASVQAVLGVPPTLEPFPPSLPVLVSALASLSVSSSGEQVGGTAPRMVMIFMDYDMPQMNGVEALSRLRALGVQVPIVIVTANTAVHSLCMAAGATSIVSKPLTRAVIREAAAAWIAPHVHCRRRTPHCCLRAMPASHRLELIPSIHTQHTEQHVV